MLYYLPMCDREKVIAELVQRLLKEDQEGHFAPFTLGDVADLIQRWERERDDH